MTTAFLGNERAAPRGASSRSALSSKLANGPIDRDMASPPAGTARNEILARPRPIVAYSRNTASRRARPDEAFQPRRPALTPFGRHNRASTIAFAAFLACTLAALFATGRIEPPPAHAATDEQKKLAWAAIERNAGAIVTLSDNIYYFAELGMQEQESAKLLAETLRSIGFRVRSGDAGFPTNVWAEWGSGSPRIAIVTEVDALPEGSQTPGSIERKPLIPGAPGHMEGHNTHAGVTAGAAYALKQVMEHDKIPGTIVLSYGPAEEQLVSRPFLVRAGLFKDIDAALLIHIGSTF